MHACARRSDAAVLLAGLLLLPQVGFTLNHAYIMGYVTRGAGIPVLPNTKMAPYDGGFGAVLPFEQWPNYAEAKANVPFIRQLLEASDFMGVSNYARCVHWTDWCEAACSFAASRDSRAHGRC